MTKMSFDCSQISNSEIARSSQFYKPGDIILKLTEPLVQVTKYEHRLFVCDRCMRRINSSLMCPLCRKVFYCSLECQDLSWNHIHQYECLVLKRHKALQFENHGIDYMQRLTLRLYLLMSNKPDMLIHRFKLHNQMERCLNDMEFHPNDLKDSAQFQGVVNYFKLYKVNSVNLDLLLRAYGILHVNAFGIDSYESDSTIEHRGTGLYVEASVFDHSCVPNACASGNGLVLEIRALSHIKPGDVITIDYVQDILPREERQRLLLERYFFTCQCEFGCGQSIPEQEKFDFEVDFRRYSVLNKVLDSIVEKQTETRTSCKDTRALSPDWHRMYEYSRQRLAIQEKYYSRSGYHPCLSLFYQSFLRFLVLNQCHMSVDIEKDFHEALLKAKQHLSVTHGVNHAFYAWLQQYANKTVE